MTASEVLSLLSERSIEVWVEGDKLRFRARKDALTPDLRDAMVANKEEIIKILREQASHVVNYYPLSYAQQSMWIVNQNSPNSAAYNVSFSARICSEVNITALHQAFQALVDRHAALRTVYSLQDDTPVQQIQGQVDVDFEQIDASKWDEASLEQQAIQAYEQPFDLAHGPMMRVYLYTIHPQNHVLLIAAHHIAVDGWSVWLLLDELRTLYDAYQSGQPASLPRIAKTYVDYAKQETDLLNGPEGERMWSFWRGRLSGDLPIINLPLDALRPQILTTKGASQVITINQALTGKLKDLGKAEGTTIFTVVLSAFAVLLYRYSGQETVLIGSPTFGRNGADLARIVDHFVNMITLRADFPPETTFRSFLGTMRRVVLDALENQDFPFPLLIQRLGGHRDPSHSALFDVTFDMQRVQQIEGLTDLFNPSKTDVRIPFGTLEMEPYLMHQQEGQFDLSVQMVDAGDTVSGMFKYRTDLFEPETIERMRAHFLTLLEGIVAQPDMSLDQLPLITETEKNQILYGWNQTASDYPQHATLHQLFEAQVEHTPEATAVTFEGQNLTYRELNLRANQLAHYLHEQGVRQETLVGVSMERSSDLLVALLGVLKAGGAYVPLDPNYPEDRRAFMLEDSAVALVITQTHLLDRFSTSPVRTVTLDGALQGDLTRQPTENPISEVGSDNLAYVIYTSGSTGRPKGVMALHRGAVNRLYWMWQTYPFEPGEVNCQKTTLNFVDAVWENFGALLQGVPTVIIPDQAVKNPDKLVEILSENNVSRIVLVPSLLRAILESGEIMRLSDLKYWITSGEALPVDLLQEFQRQLPGSKLINLYGSSEVAADVTCFDTSQYTEQATVPIGRPIANTQIYLLDANLNPVPIGGVGELYAGGAGLARGYLNRPDLTAERFIPNPFSENPDDRLYKTGDLARYLPDGNIIYRGRTDYQVKLRGIRIEMGEIESALKNHPQVKTALVILREDRPGDQRLVAYFTPIEGAAPSDQELRLFLGETLLDYMIPSAIVKLDVMPLTPNGKIDRRALPMPDYIRVERPIMAPETTAEKLVAETWQEVLGVGAISVYDNFFDLGGHSLMAMQVINKLNQKTGVKFEPAFMRFQTLKQMAVFYDTP